MNENLDHYLHLTSQWIEATGVTVIALGIFIATLLFVYRLFKHRDFEDIFTQYRQNVARGILLGLEFLVAADIIGTVLIAPTMQNVLTLGLIVVIRTFLSYSLQIEIEGHLPWHKKKPKGKL